MSVSCELSSRPVVHLTVEHKSPEERNTLFAQLIEREACLSDKRSPGGHSRRDKIDPAWCRIAEEMRGK